jgi:hypothetical protein
LSGASPPITPEYNNSTGQYTFLDVPPGTNYQVVAYVDAASPFDGRYFPGDYNNWSNYITVTEEDSVITVDINLRLKMHLTSPFDNSTSYGNVPGLSPPSPYGPYHTYSSPVGFQWDPVPGATSYGLYVQKSTGEMTVSQITTSNTQVSLNLPDSGVDDYYKLGLWANGSGGIIADTWTVYNNGYGTVYPFKASSASVLGMVFYSTTPLDNITVEVSTYPGGTLLDTTTTSTGFYSFSGLTPGQYTVRVYRPSYEYYPVSMGTVTTVGSNPVEVNFHIPKTIIQTNPPHNSTVSSNVTLQWDAIPEAAKYSVQVNRTSDWQQVVFNPNVYTNSYTIPSSSFVNGAQYTWTIRAYDSSYNNVGGCGNFQFTWVGSPIPDLLSEAKEKF